jgi:hypothetical protein
VKLVAASHKEVLQNKPFDKPFGQIFTSSAVREEAIDVADAVAIYMAHLVKAVGQCHTSLKCTYACSKTSFRRPCTIASALGQ